MLLFLLAFGGPGESPALAVPSGCGGPACVNLAGFSSDDYDLGTWNGAANQVRVNLRHCVFSNRPASGTKTYDANAMGVGTSGGAFLPSTSSSRPPALPVSSRSPLRFGTR